MGGPGDGRPQGWRGAEAEKLREELLLWLPQGRTGKAQSAGLGLAGLNNFCEPRVACCP